MDLLKLKFLRPAAPYAPLILRIAVGIIMMRHGWQKWSGGAEGVAGFFGKLGMPVSMAPALAWVVIVVELIGGLCLLLGILSRLWALLFAVVMVVAIIMARMPESKGFLDGYELEFLLFGAALTIALMGGGKPAVGPMIGVADDD